MNVVPAETAPKHVFFGYREFTDQSFSENLLASYTVQLVPGVALSLCDPGRKYWGSESTYRSAGAGVSHSVRTHRVYCGVPV